jgi:hypothetical protein
MLFSLTYALSHCQIRVKLRDEVADDRVAESVYPNLKLFPPRAISGGTIMATLGLGTWSYAGILTTKLGD